MSKAIGDAATTQYRVTFDRIGRGARGLVKEWDAVDADDLASIIYGFARSHLASREYAVLVDLDKMAGSIEYGRFGTFTIAEAVPA
jgi:hypothetical protein